MKISLLFTMPRLASMPLSATSPNLTSYELIPRNGEAEMLTKARSVDLQHNSALAALEQGKEALMSAAHETSVNASITEREMEANVGIAETKGAVLRAQAKIKAWMSKDTDDTRSPLPRGSWINPQSILVTTVQ